MKVLFVYTDVNVRGGARSYHFGIGALSAMLKASGHDARLHHAFGGSARGALRDAVRSYGPGIIAFSAVSPQYRYARRMLEELPLGDAFTVLGGQHATLAPECLGEAKGLDAVCVGEGEHALLDLAEALAHGRDVRGIRGLHVKGKDGSVRRNPPRPFIEDLDRLPFPDRELFDHQRIVDSDFGACRFLFSRGCPHDCAFCSNHALRARQDGKYFRVRSVEGCLEEIRRVTGRYRARALDFCDDCFTADRAFLEDFCRRYAREFPFPFDVNARPETLSRGVCALLREAGCRRVGIGVESGSARLRERVLRRRQSDEDIAGAFERCREAGLKTKSYNIVGLPRETPEDFQRTVDLNVRARPDSVVISVFEPYPGTALAEACQRDGLMAAEDGKADFVGRTDTVLDMPQFPREEILRCFRGFAYDVYRGRSLLKALCYRAYYSRFGEPLVRLLFPFRGLLRRLVMGV